MAWTAPRTWTTGELVTAAIMNQHVRDDLIQLYDGMPLALVRLIAAASIPDTTETLLQFPDEALDTDAMHDTVTNNERLTIKTAGKYLVGAQVHFQANATGMRHAKILRTPGGGIMAEQLVAAAGGATLFQTILDFAKLAPVQLAVNDFLECRVRQTSGGALNVELAEFWAVKVG